VGNSVNLNLSNSTVSNNDSTRGDGGGLYFGGDSYISVNVSKTSFTGNYAYHSGGAVATENSGGMVITGSTFDNNGSFYQGGAIFVDDLHLPSTVSGSTFTNNASQFGGALTLYVDYNVRHTVDSSVISGNFAYNRGGGIYLYGYANGPVTVSGDEISGNSAGRFGAGVFITSGCYQSCEIKNTTISGNGAFLGAGLTVATSGGYNPVNIVNSTIAFNTGSSPYASGFYAYNGSFNVRNTIVGKNTATGAGALTADVGGLATGITAAFSLVQGTHTGTVVDTSAGGNLMGVDPQLGALSGNGSAQRSHLPLDGSPVINAASNSLALNAGLSFDQRGPGFPRDFDHVVDIGAVEVGFTGVPTLGDLGKGALVLFCGAAGLALLRRRQRGAVVFSVLALGGGWFSISHAEAAQAASQRSPMVGRVETLSATTVAKVVRNGDTVTVDLGDGQHYQLPKSQFHSTFERVQPKQGRVVNGSHKLRPDQQPPSRAEEALNPGDNVVVRIRKDKNGNLVQLKLVKFRSSSEAQQFIARRRAKHAHDK
jgi:predicted outer membrane repeat protein